MYINTFFFTDARKEKLQEDLGDLKLAELEPSSITNSTETEDEAPPAGKELHNQPITQQTVNQVSCVLPHEQNDRCFLTLEHLVSFSRNSSVIHWSWLYFISHVFFLIIHSFPGQGIVSRETAVA